MNVHSFKVYVTKTESLITKLEPIKPAYDKPKGIFIDVLPIDYHSNSYFCSLAAAYVTTFKCEIYEDHLTNNLPDSHSNIETSIVCFHLHFRLSRFMRNPKLLNQYMTEDDIRTIRKFTPVHESWEKKNYDKPADVRKRKRRQKYHQTKYGGTFIEYEYLTGRSPSDVENDYKILIPKACQDSPELDKSYSNSQSRLSCLPSWGRKLKPDGVLRDRVQRVYKRRKSFRR
ncbi:Hypothetical predicted protein [Paramuricea clavata]|uniref:Uncharacterized protein n=1 Tax=Paramuricea clavata TaxID=317549 RepID=A0A6S7J5U0_PARCT|nr:Hypothetical predicted protein [Paramuricea clavata]